MGINYKSSIWLSLKWEYAVHWIIYGGFMKTLITGLLKSCLTEKFLIVILREILNYLVKKPSNGLSRDIIKVFEKEVG